MKHQEPVVGATQTCDLLIPSLSKEASSIDEKVEEAGFYSQPLLEQVWNLLAAGGFHDAPKYEFQMPPDLDASGMQ